MKVAIVTDSTAYIPENLLEKYHIHTVPLSVVFGDESFREGMDITTAEFYAKVKQSKDLPSTSQPAIGTFIELFEELSKDYDAIISIHLSKKFSGTYEAAKSAGNMVENVKVYPYDSELSAMPQGLYAIAAAEMVQQGKTVDEIITHLDDMKSKTRTYFMVDDLSHLQRGGRLNSAQALLGSLLNIKPILHIVDGLIVPFEKIRTRKKAINRMMSMLEDEAVNKKIVRVVFIHANNEAVVTKLREDFAKNHPEIESIISYFGPVIGTHLGEGSIGVCWYTE
ncbi:DegV family protein [Pseudogracilibacillus auburnensis]|uniref:DegV family protein with EDD domain n=1 Tax=Pseudogracilibacillus auburnensis TaxID=1494959 RepID=A0A2V3WLD5_9BACI|nr:DegV family protein [Pseudogracilibacillus auburnensis]MBO1001532.1 DegV family protein [Pseudogracilibacillus auburnensis]PXW89549.1 DegV family protein with EDD domain [Pseudogracilibacillus auburnensis]